MIELVLENPNKYGLETQKLREINKLVDSPGAVYILMLILIPQEGLPGTRSESHTQVKQRFLGTNHWVKSMWDFQV